MKTRLSIDDLIALSKIQLVIREVIKTSELEGDFRELTYRVDLRFIYASIEQFFLNLKLKK